MEKKEEKKEQKKAFAWWWLLIPIAALGAWLLFSKRDTVLASGPKADIKLCILAHMGNQGHCCSTDLQQVSIFESNSVIYVTAEFPPSAAKPAAVTGKVYWETGEDFPAKPIDLKLDEAIGDVCYVGIVQPHNGIPWSLKKYVLKLEADGQPIGEKTFEIVR